MLVDHDNHFVRLPGLLRQSCLAKRQCLPPQRGNDDRHHVMFVCHRYPERLSYRNRIQADQHRLEQTHRFCSCLTQRSGHAFDNLFELPNAD